MRIWILQSHILKNLWNLTFNAMPSTNTHFKIYTVYMQYMNPNLLTMTSACHPHADHAAHSIFTFFCVYLMCVPVFASSVLSILFCFILQKPFCFLFLSFKHAHYTTYNWATIENILHSFKLWNYWKCAQFQCQWKKKNKQQWQCIFPRLHVQHFDEWLTAASKFNTTVTMLWSAHTTVKSVKLWKIDVYQKQSGDDECFENNSEQHGFQQTPIDLNKVL